MVYSRQDAIIGSERRGKKAREVAFRLGVYPGTIIQKPLIDKLNRHTEVP